MAYINQIEINNFINKAQQKIALLGSAIATATEDDLNYDDELALSDELSSLINSLIDPWIDWEEKDIMRYIHFYNNKAKITDIPYSDIPKLRMQVVWPQVIGGNGDVTQGDLDAEIAARISGDEAVQANVDIEKQRIDDLDFSGDLSTALSEYTKTVNLFLPIGDNKTALEALTTALVTEISANTTHAADGAVHVASGEKTTWNAKIGPLDSRLTDARTPLSHQHAIADVTGLVTEVGNQVDAYVTALNLQDGVTPAFAAANVIEGSPLAIDIDDSGGPTALVLNMTVPPPEKGDTGEPFTIGTQGLAADRFNAIYNGEDDSFTYLGTDDRNIYFRLPLGGLATTTEGWTSGTPFTGENGWSPVLATQTVSAEKEVFVILDWIGGSGTKPVFTPPANPPDPLVWYIGAGGPTVFVDDATNIKGNIGATGADGPRFVIDDSDVIANKASYDGELQGFTLLVTDISPNIIYQKLSDTSGDWVGPYEWQGPIGSAASGDMTQAVYDPTSVVGDAFNMDNMVEGAASKILTATERINWNNAHGWGDHAGLYFELTESSILNYPATGAANFIAVDGLTNAIDLTGQETAETYDFITQNILDAGRLSSGAANFLRFQKDGADIFTVDVDGKATSFGDALAGFVAGSIGMNTNRVGSGTSTGGAVTSGASSSTAPTLRPAWAYVSGIGGAAGTVDIITAGISGLKVDTSQFVTIPAGLGINGATPTSVKPLNVTLASDGSEVARLGFFYAEQNGSNSQIGNASTSGLLTISGDNLTGAAATITLNSRNILTNAGFSIKGGNKSTAITSGDYHSYIEGVDTSSFTNEDGGNIIIDGGIGETTGTGENGNVLLATNRGLTIIGDITNADTTSILQVSPDTDVAILLGRTRIDSRTTDEMTISHFDKTTNANFSLKQTSTGDTYLNSEGSGAIYFQQGGVTAWTISGIKSLLGGAGNNLTLGSGAILDLGSKADPDPTGYATAVYYNTTSNTIRWHNGTSWASLGQTPWATKIDAATNYLYNIPTIRDSNENEILGFASVASAVNYIEATNASDADPNVYLKSVGGSASVNFRFEAKGSGAYFFESTTNGLIAKFTDKGNLLLQGSTSVDTLTNGLTFKWDNVAEKVYFGNSTVQTAFLDIKATSITLRPNNANSSASFYGTGSGTTLLGNSTGKLAFFAGSGVVKQTTTSQTPATFAANTSAISDDTATWNGYTMGDLVAILQAYGLLT